jgi:carbon monoxide dehydrogenase subunit G
MPSIEQQFEVNVSSAEAWSYFSDIPRVAQCVPGLERLEQTADRKFSGNLKVKLGMIQPTFGGELEILEVTEPRALVARISGKDVKSSSLLTVVTRLELDVLAPDRTLVRMHAEVSIVGSLGNFGWGLFAKKAAEMGDAFANCARRTLSNSVEAR